LHASTRVLPEEKEKRLLYLQCLYRVVCGTQRKYRPDLALEKGLLSEEKEKELLSFYGVTSARALTEILLYELLYHYY